jgi:SPP1 family predicted phage head-tail adaptor
MRERVRFEARVMAKDGYGNNRAKFEAKFSRAAAYLMKPGSEAVLAARLQSQQPVTIIVRFDPDTQQIKPDWRVVDERTNEVFAIRAAADMDRRRQWMTLVCVAGEVA